MISILGYFFSSLACNFVCVASTAHAKKKKQKTIDVCQTQLTAFSSSSFKQDEV